MDDLISRQAVISELKKYVDYSDDGEQEINSDIVFITLKEFPSAERRGRWVDLKCDQCGQVDMSKPNYCPNCGARMEATE